MSRRTTLKLYRFAAPALLAAVLSPGAVGDASAQGYPARPVRLIVPAAPGGDTDVVARTLSRKLTEGLGQSFVVENRAGANGILAFQVGAKAPADGYTLILAATGLVINPSLYRSLPYDAVQDFAPVSLVATAPHVLAVHPSVPVKSVRELIAFAKANPDKLTYSSGGKGASSHLSGAMFAVAAGIRLVHVPYRGAGPAAVAAMTGEVSCIFLGVQAASPHVKSGRLRGLAVTSKRRSPAIPDLPTISESGLPNFESGGWFGMLAPAGTPGPVVARLHTELQQILGKPDTRETFLKMGSDVVGSTPEQFGTYIRSEIDRWAKAIKDAGIRAE